MYCGGPADDVPVSARTVPTPLEAGTGFADKEIEAWQILTTSR
jgi:hypothetical protein